jgi:protein farnesyltransferase/geranylgeranyltransferase type-1 subunit alpha
MKGTLPPLLSAELTLMDELAVQFLKTYQVWHHRRLLVSLTKRPSRELAVIKRSLEVDSKNYHTWSYRQWLLSSFYGTDKNGQEQQNEIDDADNDGQEAAVEAHVVWNAELDFVDTMLIQDVRNNSAWHHRFFVIFHTGGTEREGEKERIFKRELM